MKVLLRTQSDARLVALARAGHDRAFEAIVERYRRPLLRACRRILPEARAEDALQQALVAAWTALRRGDEVQELRPWLYRIVRNTALNQLRVAGYDLDELVDTLAATQAPEEEVERRALVRQTLMAVAALPERQRDALLRTAIEGRGQDEVARDLGLTNTALRQLVHRARTSVRATATAVVPVPLAAWLATVAPRAEPMTARIAELVAGSSAGATLAKAGTVAVLAGGAVSAPAMVDQPPRAERPVREHAVRRAETASAPVVPARKPQATPTVAPASEPQAAVRHEPAKPERRQVVQRDDDVEERHRGGRDRGDGDEHETREDGEDRGADRRERPRGDDREREDARDDDGEGAAPPPADDDDEPAHDDGGEATSSGHGGDSSGPAPDDDEPHEPDHED